MGEIEGNLYYKFVKKYTSEKEEIEDEIKKNSLESLNLNTFIEKVLQLTYIIHGSYLITKVSNPCRNWYS
jgi:hypothetical protein